MFRCREYLIGLDVFNPYLFNVSVIFQSELMILMLPNWATLRGKAELTNCHDVKKLLEVCATNFKYNRYFSIPLINKIKPVIKLNSEWRISNPDHYLVTDAHFQV